MSYNIKKNINKFIDLKIYLYFFLFSNLVHLAKMKLNNTHIILVAVGSVSDS